ncbi:hypothetical protein M569_04042, partial [Genlisea aurea]
MNEQQAAMMNQQQQQLQPMNLNQHMINMSQMTQPQPQPQMVPMNYDRGYGVWPAPPHFQNPNRSIGVLKQPLTGFRKSLGPRNNWKGKNKKSSNPIDKRRIDQQKSAMMGVVGSGNQSFTNYQPPALNELQHQNRLKTRKFFPKKNFNKNNSGFNMDNSVNSRSAPYAPRNTTSFIIRAKKSGGIASLVSPSPVTPSILPTPIFSPSREVLVDMAKEEWGVDGYGSMKGLIRLRSPGHELETNEEEEDDEGGSSESDVEEHVEVERRLDHDLSRFEMIYNPNSNSSTLDFHHVLENRVDDQDSHIAQLEEENLIMRERLFLMERELGDLRRRMQFLEQKGSVVGENNEEVVVENDSENEVEEDNNNNESENGN